MALEGLELQDIDAAITKVIRGEPEPVTFAPTCAELAQMVRRERTIREGREKHLQLPERRDFQELPPTPAQKRIAEGLEKLSKSLAVAKRA